MMMTTIHAGTMLRIKLHQGDEGGGDQQLVGDGIQQHPDGRHLGAPACQVAVDGVGQRGGDEDSDASSSRSPLAELKRLLERIQISTGMLSIRASVM